MRTVCKWFRRSNGHLTLKIWTPTDMSGKRCTKLFPKLHPKPKAVSELKFTLDKTWENFLQKSCPDSGVSERGWESRQRLMEDILSISYKSKKVFTVTVFALIHCLECYQCETAFDKVKTAKKLPWLKAAKSVNSLYNVIKLTIFATSWMVTSV